jgi:hypothetical protein
MNCKLFLHCARRSTEDRLTTDQKVGGSNPLEHTKYNVEENRLFCYYNPVL